MNSKCRVSISDENKGFRLRYAAAAKSLQSCPTLCDPIDGSPPGFPVPGILQARTLEWIPISFCNVWKWKVNVKSLSLLRLLATPWTSAHHAPPSMGFSRQEYWSGLPLPSLWDMLVSINYSMDFKALRKNTHTFILAPPCSTWGLSFPTRDGTHVPYGRGVES